MVLFYMFHTKGTSVKQPKPNCMGVLGLAWRFQIAIGPSDSAILKTILCDFCEYKIFLPAMTN